MKIVEVRDIRRFEVDPGDPSQPSLGDAAEIKDAKITERAIGRKRGGFGNALGDLALPDGRTVASVAKDAARAALQEKGYRVVDEGATDYAKAMPLTLTVEQFWAWLTPGFFSLTVSFDSRVAMSGNDLLLKSPVTAIGRYSTGTVAAVEDVWRDVINRGVADLTKQMEEAIKPAPVLQGGHSASHQAADLGS